jgi:hypothetical protein
MVEIPVRVRTAEDHQNLYVHGAMGGFFLNYHYRIDFYRDEFPPLKDVVMSGNEVRTESLKEIDRTVLASIYMSPTFAKELRNWLDKNIAKMEAEYGEIVLPKGDEDDEQKDAISKIKKEA